MQYKLTQIKPKIFLMEFKNHYDLGMTFLRYQEYYESRSSKFRGKNFTIIDFMEWYAKEYGAGIFTYPLDWSGYNIPSHIISSVRPTIEDNNKYDEEMYKIYDKCQKEVGDDFYLIGAQDDKQNDIVIKHELAHGFFYTNAEYRKKMTALVGKLTPSFRNKMKAELKEIGYTPKVYIDEMQAYLSTGMIDSLGKVNTQDKPFVELYKMYYDKKD
jgi:hypothetical protein